MDVLNYVKPELLIVSVVLYFIGMWIKQSKTINNKWIPLILGGIGIVICGLWVFANSTTYSGRDIGLGIFTAFTQGVLVAGLSTYVNQIIKQLWKKE